MSRHIPNCGQLLEGPGSNKANMTNITNYISQYISEYTRVLPRIEKGMLLTGLQLESADLYSDGTLHTLSATHPMFLMCCPSSVA